MAPVLVVLAVFVALELWSVPRRVAPEYKLVGCIELLAVLVREQAVALVELAVFEVLALRAVLVAVAGDAGRLATGKLAEVAVLALRAALVAAVGDAGRLATGKSAEVAVLKFVVVQVQVCFRSAVVECKSGCIELPTASLVALVALVGLAVLEVWA